MTWWGLGGDGGCDGDGGHGRDADRGDAGRQLRRRHRAAETPAGSCNRDAGRGYEGCSNDERSHFDAGHRDD